MKKKLLVILVVALVHLNFAQLSGWDYRKELTIDNSSNSTLFTNYQIKVIVNHQTLVTEGKSKSDAGDIRITNADGITLLPYWIESGINTNQCIIWLKMPTIPASSITSIFFYYGNISATSLSNGENVFEFFDDFESGTINATKWNVTSNAVINSTDPYQGLYSAKPNAGNKNGLNSSNGLNNIPIVAEGAFYDSVGGLNFWAGFQDSNNEVNVIGHNGDGGYGIHYDGGIGGSIGIDRSIGWHTFKVFRTDTTIRFGLDEIYLSNWINYSNSFSFITFYSASGSGKLDNIRVRKFSDTEPTISLNSEETLPIDTTTTWKMQLKASISSYQDNENFAGVSDNATDLQDASFDTAKPPTSPGNYVSLYFPHAEWNSLTGDNFARDIKNNIAFADTVKRWYFQVTSNVVNDTVTFTFVNDRIPTSFGKYLTDLKTGKRVNLKNTLTYKYYNTSDTARSFMLIIGDSIAPELTLNTPNGSNIWRSGTSKNITWNTNDGTGIDSIWVYYSSNTGNSYSLLFSLGIAQSHNWTVPNEYLNHDYSVKIITRDSLGNQSSVRSTKTFTVVGDSLASTNAAGWSLISVPLSPIDSSVHNIFGNTSYLWSYTQLAGYTQPSKIALGNGYWLGVTATKNWNVKGIADETDSSVQNLQPGYNIIGNNFVRNVSKSNLYFLKSGSYYDFNSAVSGGLISNSLYGYSSSMYSSVDTMSLFGGYWIGVLQSGVQLIQKPNNSVVTPLAKQSQSFALNWELPIKVSTTTLADNIATIGIKPSSSNQFDALYDAPRPPRNPGSNYLEMYFTNSGGNYPAVLGTKYAKDFRDSSSANWNFTIEGSQNGDVTLLWNKTLLEGLAGSLQLDLQDYGNGAVIDMKQVGSYTFPYSTPRLFSINAKITGVEKNKENLPTEFSLSQNYPNPFNPSTTIQYQLPVSGIVNLKVFDVLGKEIAILVNKEQERGNYSVPFNAFNLTSGMYFYKLQLGNFVQVKKMQLIK